MSVDHGMPSPGRERPLYRAARGLTRYGVPGAILAFLLLRIAALVPLTLSPAKTATLLPVILFCCYELTWLFGWVAGALIIAQMAAHEWAHASEARRQGRAPGSFAFIPLVGPFRTADSAAWSSREAEARVAMEGPVRGLLIAAFLFAGAVLLDSPLLRLAAFGGFMVNLVHLLPLRPFDGGRLLPGEHLHATLSWMLLSATRWLAHLAGLDRPDRPQPFRRALGPGLFLLIAGGAVLTVLAALLLPPLVAALGILCWVAGTVAVIRLAIRLHPAAQAELTGRAAPSAAPGRPVWQDRAAMRASALGWAGLATAHATGALVSWS